MIRFFQLALRLRHGETPVANELFRQETTLTRFVLSEKVVGPKSGRENPRCVFHESRVLEL